MKLTVASSLIASIIAGLAMTSVAQANDAEGAFVGAGAGWNRYQDLNQERDAFSSRLLGGYTFNENLALEAGYDWLGHGKNDGGTWRADGWTASVLPSLPLS